MARDLQRVELGFAISAENGTDLAHQLAGSAAPGADGGEQDAAPLGTTYQRTDGTIYIKVASANLTTDWSQLVTTAGDSVQISADGITTATTVDTQLVDQAAACEWELYIRDAANPDNVIALKIFATHDGTASADAATVDDTVYSKLRLNSNFNVDVEVILTGTGGTQTMGLQITSSELAGVDIRARRNCVLF